VAWDVERNNRHDPGTDDHECKNTMALLLNNNSKSANMSQVFKKLNEDMPKGKVKKRVIGGSTNMKYIKVPSNVTAPKCTGGFTYCSCQHGTSMSLIHPHSFVLVPPPRLC